MPRCAVQPGAEGLVDVAYAHPYGIISGQPAPQARLPSGSAAEWRLARVVHGVVLECFFVRQAGGPHTAFP